MESVNRHIALIFSVSLFFQLSGQHLLPLGQSQSVISNRYMVQSGLNQFSTFKPIAIHELEESINYDSLLAEYYHSTKIKTSGWFGRKLFKESFFTYRDSSFSFKINPYVNLEASKDERGTYWTNMRGIGIKGAFSKQLTFETQFFENQSIFPQYIDEFVRNQNVVPGQGKRKNFQDNGHDYAWVNANFSFYLNKNIEFRAGNGKHFIGNGYRSLLLSDNSFNYPFADMILTFGNWRYIVMMTSMMDDPSKNNGDQIIEKKAATFHMLSKKIGNHTELSFFDGTILGRKDNANYALRIWNPLLGVNPFFKENHSVFGYNLRANLWSSVQIYHQGLFDNKYSGKINGIQAGLNIFDPFGIKNLFIRAEFNEVIPYTYATTDRYNSYSHYNQPLAHPLGTGFQEFLLQGNYQYRFLNLSVKSMNAKKLQGGPERLSMDLIPDPQISQSWEFINQTLSKVNEIDFQISLILNPQTRLGIFFGILNRKTPDNSGLSTQLIYGGFRTDLENFYFDF